MSKKMFMVLALTVVFVFAATGAAFAAWGDGTYLPDAGNPHGGYLTSTSQCGVCHSVHGASAGGEALLQSTKALSCTYCHITSGAYTTVYNGNAGSYSVAVNLSNAHNTVAGGTQYSQTVGCPDCHTVHGNNAVTVTDGKDGNANNLRNLFVDSRGASFRAMATQGGRTGNYTTFYTAANATLMTQWCSQCHPYYNQGVNGASHRMVAADGQHAFVKSSDCRDCHDNQLTGAVNTFPHIADGARFMSTAGNSGAAKVAAVAAGGRVTADGACLKCHVNATSTSGVSITY